MEKKLVIPDLIRNLNQAVHAKWKPVAKKLQQHVQLH